MCRSWSSALQRSMRVMKSRSEKTSISGAVLAMAATGGAMVSHLTFLGIEVQGDKGLLFFLAILVFLTSAVALILHRGQIPVLGRKF